MKLYALIGYPLGHSFSKKYFTGKFEKEGREDCFFELFPLENIEELQLLLRQNPQLKGLAVTIPYKQTVMAFLDELSAEAESIGAVNCIQFHRNGKLKGFNTDIIGFERSFIPLLKPHHAKALVLGTGGASKAVTFALTKLGINFLSVSRIPNGPGQVSYSAIDQSMLQEYNIIINCTPVGMTPGVEAAPDLPYSLMSANNYCYDLIYTPEETSFLRKGREQGAIVKNGYEMLLIQAEENWKIWNEADKLTADDI